MWDCFLPVASAEWRAMAWAPCGVALCVRECVRALVCVLCNILISRVSANITGVCCCLAPPFSGWVVLSCGAPLAQQFFIIISHNYTYLYNVYMWLTISYLAL